LGTWEAVKDEAGVAPVWLGSFSSHDDPQRELVAGYLTAYGDSNRGLGNIFGMGKNVRNFYRRIKDTTLPQPQSSASGVLSESP
jgi:hypothetical protein